MNKFRLSFRHLWGVLGIVVFSSASWSQSLYDGNFSVLSNQLPRDSGPVEGNRMRADFDFRYKEARPGLLEKNFAIAAHYNDANSLLFSLKEANLIHRYGLSEVTAGRQVLNWSPMDEQWGFGKLNNRVNFNFFDPGQEGLTGLNIKIQYDNGFYFELFGSVINVPELNPGFRIDNDNGTITSRSPWTKAPATSTIIDNDDVPIRYQVDMPNLTKVLVQASLGANIGFKSELFDFNAFAMRKPENNITSAVEVTYRNQEETVFARVTPQVFMHDIFGATAKANMGNVSLSVSALSIRPNQFPQGNELVTQYTSIETEKRNEDYVSTGVDFQGRFLQWGLHYVARVSDFDLTGDILAQAPRWNQAMNAYVKARLFKRIDFQADVKYDTLTYDRLTMFSLAYQTSRYINIVGGVEIIGTPEQSESFWADFRNNDAAYVAVQYVF